MIDFDVKVTGMLTFAKTKDVQQAISRGIRKAGQIVANQARQNADGRPGPFVQTGRLRASINSSGEVGDMSVTVGTPVEYGPRIELGFKGTENVKEHYRSVGSFTRNRRGRRVKAQGPANRVLVNAFTRNANSPAYPFLRPAAEFAIRQHIIEDLITRELDLVLEAGGDW